ncbi:MAG: CvpA family protein [Planctomycetota bacterium]|nr:CvpA family protein [Planctomycetota bacterium]
MQSQSYAFLAAVEFRWLDILGLALVLYFLVIGARRGMWWQIVRLMGIVATVAVARAAAPRIAPRFAEAFPDLSVRVAGGIVWTIVILLGLLVVALVGRLGKESLEAAQLGTIDRVGGALAGALTGVLVHAAIVLCLCQVGAADWSVAQVRGTTSQRLVDSVGRKLPLFLDAQARETLEPWFSRPVAAR